MHLFNFKFACDRIALHDKDWNVHANKIVIDDALSLCDAVPFSLVIKTSQNLWMWIKINQQQINVTGVKWQVDRLVLMFEAVQGGAAIELSLDCVQCNSPHTFGKPRRVF
jgi:hypothetical protein